jgi:tRNA (guanine6-N2)-methyltransferase
MNSFYITVFPGLDSVVLDELAEDSSIKIGEIKRMRNTSLVFLRTGNPQVPLSMATVEDVFSHLGTFMLRGGPDDLKALGRLPLFGNSLTGVLNLRAAHNGAMHVNRLSFRVIVQADDALWRSYRRIDIQEAAETAIRHAHPGWRLVRDEAPVEIWLQQIDHELILGLRLTNGRDRQHGGRAVERDAALRPSVAAAMVRLSHPSAEDVFMDPMCGSGTILLERATWGRYSLLIGGDSDSGAVAATLANFGPRHKPRRIELWDARRLPLEAALVNKIVCNLPWGHKIGKTTELDSLYRNFLSEAARVLSSGGIMVLLTSEWKLLKRMLTASRDLDLYRTVPHIEILGRQADIFVIRRR